MTGPGQMVYCLKLRDVHSTLPATETIMRHALFPTLLLSTVLLCAHVGERVGAQVVEGGNQNEDPLATELIEAKAELDAARLVLAQTENAVEGNQRIIENVLKQSGEYRQLVARVQLARTKHELAQRPILELLREDDEYARLRNEQTSARQIISEMVDDQRASFLELLPHAKKALEMGRKMRREEIIALALDPAVDEARQAWITENNKLRELNGAYRNQARTNDSVRIAAADLEAARARVDAAQDRVQTALTRISEREQLQQERAKGKPKPTKSDAPKPDAK